MAKMVDPKTYARNVIKSAGYITTATIKGVNPSLTQYVTDTASSAKEMYRSVRDYKNTARNKINGILGETGYEDLKKVKSNVMDDLRSGKFYNPEREDEASKSLMEKMGWSASFDFDDIDFDVDENVGEKVAEDTATASSIVTLADKISGSQKAASASSAKAIVSSGRVNTTAMMAHDEKMFGQLNSSLANIHSSVINLHKDLAEPLNAHIVNSANFYGVATTELSKHTAILENIQKMLSDRFAPTGPMSGGKMGMAGSTWKAVMGGGLPNLGAWGKAAKNKLMSNTGMDMFGGMDPEMIQMLLQTGMASPIAMVLSGLGSSAIRRSSIGKGLNRTVGTLKGGFNHMAVRISQYAKKHQGDFTLPALLASLFDIMPSGKAKMDFANYNKGRQDWTGMDSKALREVIPTQLAQILSAITGKQPKVFDYKSGRFVTSSQLKDDFNRERNAAIGNSSSELRQEILDEFIAQDKKANQGRNVPEMNYNSKAVRNLSHTYDTLVSMLSIKNVDVSNFKSANELLSFCRRMRWVGSDLANGGRDYIFDEKHLRRLAKIIYSSRVPGIQGRFEGAVIGGQITNADMVSNAGNTTYGMIHNGSGLDDEDAPASAVGSAISNLLENKDKYGNDVFFYLHSYYDQLRILVDRSNGAQGGNRRDVGTRARGPAPSSANSRNEREGVARPRATRVPSLVQISASSSGSDDDAISDDDRLQFNSATQEYEEPNRGRSIPGSTPTSRNTRRKNEKDSIFTKVFDKTNAFFDDLFYGNSDTGLRAKIREHGGLLGSIRDIPQAVQDAYKAITDKIKEFAKNTWNKFKDSDFGKQFFGNMKDSVKNFAKGTWDQAKEGAGNLATFFTGKTPSWAAKVDGSRRGGVVRKSGMASVSEGEIIIPADQNPDYDGHMGNAARDSIEKTNYKNWLKDGGDEEEFFGCYRKGGKAKKKKAWKNFSDDTKAKIEEMYNEGNTAEEISKAVKKPVGQVKGYIAHLNVSGATGQAADNVKDKAKQIKDSKAGQYVEKLFKDATTKVDDALTHLFGESETYNNAKKYASEAKKTAKENLPKTFSDAALGGLVGAAVTGSGLGLIGGMVIGAGASIIKRSDVISDALFGKEDAEGNYSGGMLPDKVTKFIKKRLPKVGKSAAIGGVLGTLGFAPGGIFGGMAIGAGLELVSTTDTFKDIMFGKPNVHGERTGGIMGSIRDHVVNPLINFTKNGLTKIGDYIKENFLNPIKSLFDPIKDWMKGKAKKMASGIVDAAKTAVKRTVGEKFNAILKPVAEKVGKAGKWALGAAGKVASAPFKFASAFVGENLTAHNIKAGYSSKSAKERMAMEGKAMGVRARIPGLKNLGGVNIPLINKKFSDIPVLNKLGPNTVKNTGYTKWAADASDEDVIAASHYVNGANTFNKSIIKKRQDLADTITASLRNGGNEDPKTVKQLKSLFNTDKVRKSHDYSDIIEAVNGLSDDQMGAETKKAVLERINASQKSILDEQGKLNNFNEDQEAFFNRIGLTSAKDRKKFMKEARVQSQLDAAGIMKASDISGAEALAKPKEKDDAAKLLKEQEQENPLDAKRNSILSSILDVVTGFAKHSGVDDSDIPDSHEGGSSEEGNKFTSGLPGTGVPSLKQSGADANEGGEAPEGTIKTEFVDGKPVQFIYRSGQWVENMADSGTKNAVEDMEEDRRTKNAFFGAFTGGSFLDKLRGIFTGSGDKDEKKETLWDKIKNIFGKMTSSDGILGKISSGISGLLPGIVKALPGIATALGIGYVANKIADKSAGTGLDSGMNKDTDPEERKAEVENMTGIKGFVQKTGIGIDAIENKIRGRDTTTYSEDDYVTPYMTDRYTTRMAKNVILGMNPKYAKAATAVTSKTIGKIPVVGKALGGGLNLSTKATEYATKLGTGVSKAGKTVKNVAEKAVNTKAGQKVAEVAGKATSKAKNTATKLFSAAADKSPVVKKVAGVASTVVSKIKSAVSMVFNAIVSKLGLKSAGEAATKEALDKVSQETAETIVKKAPSKFGSFMAKATVVLQIALIANAVIAGFQKSKAKTILGILDEPTTMQRILAAACNGINEAIPGIGGIIPTETLFSIVFTALTALGCKFDTLAEQRKQAKATVEAYNQENGTTYNIEEYIHNVLGEYTFQEKIAQGIKKGWNTVKKGVSTVVDKFKSIFTGRKDDDEEAGAGTSENDKTISMGDVNTNYSRLNGSVSSTTSSSSANSSAFATGSGASNVNNPYVASGTHTTQKGNFRVFAGSSIDKNGCGPASASTVLKSYGKNVSVNDAATYAEAGGYVAGDSGVSTKGTKASYFGDILGKNGIKTSYTDKKDQIKAAVSSGNPTILLGQDKNNNSKSNSPFGPNPHYVVTQGVDKKGNIIVDDPELNGTALYKRDILNKTKLGVATAGDSGVSGLLTSALTGFTSAVSNKLGDSAAGKVWNFITGNTSSSDSEDSDSSSTTSASSSSSSYSSSSSSSSSSSAVDAVSGAAVSTSGRGKVTYGSNKLFTIAEAAPSSDDPNIKCFNNSSNGGISPCITGNPKDSTCNVLSNCVGWASGRFNQIYNLLTGTNNQFKYPFACNAKNFIATAKTYGLSTGDLPQVGAIMVWSGGKSGCGHVAIVERVDSDTKVLTSESGYKSFKFKQYTRNKSDGNGNWNSWTGGYKFLGFIYNPAVTYKSNYVGTEKLSSSESKTRIWKNLKQKGLSDYAISGAMGCWQAESGNLADRVEGDYLGSYPGSSSVLANRKSLSSWTSGKLFDAYARSNISINKNAYLGSDGYYYPGLGLAQWTGPRAKNLIDYGDQTGKNFRNVDTQLDFFWDEFTNRSGLKDKMNSAKSPEDATTKFLDGFEMYDGWHNTSTGKKQNSTRQGYAKDIYNTYKGTGSGVKPVTYDFTNPNNDPFGAGSSADSNVVMRRARTTSGAASNIKTNIDQLNQIISYIKVIAENTANNQLLKTLVELQNDTVNLLAKVSSSKNTSTSSSAASEDYQQQIENDIAKMKSKLDNIAQTL